MQGSINSKKPGYLKTLMGPTTTIAFNIFAEILRTFPTYQCLQKNV